MASKFIYSFHHAFVRKTKFEKNGVPVTPEFDFIVVGGGPSGCALATRLFQDGTFSVLLVEQGTTLEQQPELKNCVNNVLQTRVLHGSSFDSQYPTLSEGQFGRRKIVLNSGKVLGGSTCINWAIWSRGSKSDYDTWAALVEDESFNWENMLLYFNRVEKPHGPISTRKISTVDRDQSWSGIADASFSQSGLKKVDDFLHARDILGYGEMRENIDESGHRCTANAYLEEIAKTMSHESSSEEPRFQVWTALEVQKILFEEKNGAKVASRVMTPFGFIRAGKAVILTAGAIQSPHLLLLSGIGAAPQLNECDIPVVHDSQDVGRNLWDHPFVDVMFRIQDSMRRDTIEDLASLKTSAKHLDKWAKKKTGLMSGLPYEWMAYSNFKNNLYGHFLTEMEDITLRDESLPHVEQMIFYGHGLDPAPDPLESSYIAISNVLLTPTSRGSVSLSSSKTSLSPNIVLNQLSKEVDQELMVAALEKAYTILRAPAWAEYLKFEDTPDRNTLLEMVKNRLSTLWHIGGTCSMKTKYTPGVVDTAFQVLGVRGLHVADTSVIPFPITAHTQSIAYVLGEKAAVRILQDYKSKSI